MNDQPEKISTPTNQEAVKNLTAGRDITIGNITQKAGDHIVKIIKKPVSIAVGIFTAIVGTVGIIFAGRNTNNSIITYGNVTDSTIANEVTIYTGDSPEVKKKKIEQAKNIIAVEIFTNIHNIDARLGLVETALKDDNFEQNLRDVRNKVAPSLNEIFDSGYGVLINQQTISSLRAGFNGLPLNEVRSPLIQVLIDGNADAKTVQAFSSSLTEVQYVSESLFNDLSTTQETSTKMAQSSKKLSIAAYNKKSIKLDVARLKNRSQIAYLRGLIVLDSLKITLSNAQESLSSLKHLEPRQLVTKEEAIQLLTTKVKEGERILAERTILLAEIKNLRDAALDEYAKLEAAVIQPSDPWNVVSGKAIALRQLGRTTESVAAFSRYADMFSEKDSTAKQYSRTAQQFTTQLHSLHVDGGVYIYEVVQGGVAESNGIKVGDIIIQYGDKAIANMPDIVMALHDHSIGNSIPITYLRMSSAGVFQRQTVSVNSAAIGASMMPI